MIYRWLVLIHVMAVLARTSTFNHSIHCEKKGLGLNSFLWTIERMPPAYLFGTIHVPYDRVWQWIPHNSKVAFSNSDSAIFELDLTNPFTMTSLAECQMLPAGQLLSDVLPIELYSRLESHFQFIQSTIPSWISAEQIEKGFTAEMMFNSIAGNWRRKRPVWIMLLVDSLTEAGVKSRGIPVLDLFLAQQTQRDGKMTGAIERVEEQCIPLNKLNSSQVIFALNETLNKLEDMRSQAANSVHSMDSMDTLVKQYTCGYLDSMMFNRHSTQVPSVITSPHSPTDMNQARQIEHYFQRELIDARNARMAQRIVFLLKQYPHTSFFFAIGAGHLVGQDTVIDRLRQYGLNVVHTKPDENITRYTSINGRNKQRLATDSLYGDVGYLITKRKNNSDVYWKEREKMKLKERQERLDQLWEMLVINKPQYIEPVTSKQFTLQQYSHSSSLQRQERGSTSVNISNALLLIFVTLSYIG